MKSILNYDLSTRRWLLIIMLLAVVLRIGASFYLGNELLTPQQTRVWDQVSYNALALSILDGRGYSFDRYWYPFTQANTPTAHWSFVYPLYLAGIYALTGFVPLVARVVQAVISGVLSAWLLFRLGRRLFGEPVGLLAAAAGAVYLYFIYHDAALMTESFFILGVLAMLDLSLEIAGHEQLSKSQWLVLGAVMGITALLRQSILLWLPFHFAWLVWACRRNPSLRWWQPALSLAVMVILILPWTVRNYLVYSAFLPLNSNAGYALYAANHPNHGIHFDQDYVAPLPDDLKNQGLNEAQWNTALTRRGLEFILTDPQRYALLSLSRVGIFFNFWFSPESSTLSNLMRLLSFGVYLPFFLIGLVRSLPERRRASLIYLFAVVYSLMHILTWASIRYRLPVDAAMMPFAALAVFEIYRWARSLLNKQARAAREIPSS